MLLVAEYNYILVDRVVVALAIARFFVFLSKSFSSLCSSILISILWLSFAGGLDEFPPEC